MTVGSFQSPKSSESCCPSICYRVAVETKMGSTGKLSRMCVFKKKSITKELHSLNPLFQLLFTELHISQEEWNAIDLWLEICEYDENNIKPFENVSFEIQMVPLLKKVVDINGQIDPTKFQKQPQVPEHSPTISNLDMCTDVELSAEIDETQDIHQQNLEMTSSILLEVVGKTNIHIEL